MIELHNPHLSDDDSSSEFCHELDDFQEGSVYHAAEHQSSFSTFMNYPSPPARHAGYSEETCARVLTSKENIKALEEKKQKKDEAEEKS